MSPTPIDTVWLVALDGIPVQAHQSQEAAELACRWVAGAVTWSVAVYSDADTFDLLEIQ